MITLVTGGSRGIGAAIARRLAADGHDVAITFRRAAEDAAAVVEAVRAVGRRALAIRADIAAETEIDAAFAQVADELGAITGLVNNAGITGPIGPLVDLDTADLRRVIEVDVLGAMLCTRRAVRAMRDTGGAIVNISSAAATLGGPGEYVHYAAAKAAVDAFTVGLAKEVGSQGIRVNAVAPGLVNTSIHAAAGEPGRIDRVAPQVPLGRAGEPEEIASAVAWLLSAEACYTTGAVLRVAGGR